MLPCTKQGALPLPPAPATQEEEAMSTNPQDGSRPTLVLVHGAWADGSGWQGVYDQLKDTYSVRIVQEPNLSLEGDVEATKMVIGQQSEPVILVGHSYGGVVVTEAAFMADSQVPWGVEALTGTVGEAAWRSKPSWYLVATEDRMIPPATQRS